MKIRFLILALLCIFLSGTQAAQPVGLGVSVYPSRFRLKQEPGEAVTAKIYMVNEGETPIVMSTEMADMVSRVTEEGHLVRDEAPPGTSPFSCARWIQVLSGEGEKIQPGTKGELEFVISPPPDVREGGYSAYLFMMGTPVDLPDLEKTDKPQVRLVTIPRMGISVIYEVIGTVRRTGELTALELFPPVGTEPMRVRHAFKNTGNAEVVLACTFHILDDQGLLLDKGSLKTLKSFPGDVGSIETTLTTSLEPGHYTMLLTFELGPDSTEAIVRELEFDISA